MYNHFNRKLYYAYVYLIYSCGIEDNVQKTPNTDISTGTVVQSGGKYKLDNNGYKKKLQIKQSSSIQNTASFISFEIYLNLNEVFNVSYI